MEFVEPGVRLIAATTTADAAINYYLEDIGAENWETDADDGEKLIEICGRACYRSFKPGLNPNVKKVREGNRKYIQHLIEVGHGSVLEHVSGTFLFTNVSRVFTHELVRHRVGVAMSQESLRFVRLTDLKMYLPSCFKENDEATAIFLNTVEYLEEVQRELAKVFGLDDDKVPFSRKKEVTSAMRRLAPIGLGTSIAWTANLRTLRHVIEMRTDPAAEEEIRYAFDKVATICSDIWPNVFCDYERQSNGHWTTEHRKV